jgi:hypothetical protein
LTKNKAFDHIVIGDAIHLIARIAQGETFDKIIYGGSQEFNTFPLLNPKLLDETGYPPEPTHAYTTEGRKAIDIMFSK